MSPAPGDKRRSPVPGNEEVTLPPTEAGTLARDGAPGKPPAPPVPPELVKHPRYRVLQLLGQGGMGAVYLAEHLVMGRRVAIKTINAHFLSSREAVGRFRREVRAAARLAHPNVVAAHDAEQAGGLHFLVMEYVDGMSVSEFARRKGPLPVETACAICAQAALGLQHAHEQGLVHRDIKPANLMLTSKGHVKVLDFGLACFAHQQDPAADAGLTATGAVLGTADYIAPEQTTSSRKVDVRADVYSLGCTLYYLLAGRVPFPEGTAIDKFIHHAINAPASLSSLRPALPAALVAVVEKMMAKRPEDRYQTPAEVYQVLRPFAGSGKTPAAAGPEATPRPRADAATTEALTGGAARPGKATKPGGPRGRRVVLAVVGGLIAAGLAALALWYGLGGRGKDSGRAAEGGSGRATGANFVAWTGQGENHVFADPERPLRGILEFRELLGATPKEFADWRGGLGTDYRVAFLSNRNGLGPPLFNAVAVKERAPVTARVFTGLTEEEAGKVEEKLKAEGAALAIVGHASYAPAAGQWSHSQLWTGEHNGYLWIGTIDYVRGQIEMERTHGNRPYIVDAVAYGDERWYYVFGEADQGVAWKWFEGLTPQAVLATVEKYREQGWRPDVLAPYWDGERFVFFLLVRDNPEHVDWRLQIDMSRAECAAATAGMKAQGLFPLTITSYGDEVDVRYAALWVRYRLPK
jgi:tRNA A-37 threonylcarbamoyl transferase component Bud32